MRNLVLAVLLSLGLSATASQAAKNEPDCRLAKYAEIPVVMIDRRPTVAAKIDGKPVRLLLDTGDFFSTLGADQARRLGLPLKATPYGIKKAGIGGTAEDTKMTTAAAFQFGPMQLKKVDFFTTSTGGFNELIVGNLGENVLGDFDVEYDFAGGAIRIFSLTGECELTSPVYWSTSYSTVHLDPTLGINNAVVAKASINGKEIRVQFDTGAESSTLSLKAASQIGFTPKSEGVESAGISAGFGKKQVETWTMPVASFSLGDESIKRTQLHMGAMKFGDGVDMLLGADFFLSHRVLISPHRQTVYFTYGSGLVFGLPPPHAAPTDAAGFARRGVATLALGNARGAIADLDRAIELDPRVGQFYVDRARARQATGEAVLVMADLAQAISLQPDNVQARMMRGNLYMSRRDEPRAREDFAAALSAANNQPGLEIAIGNTYDRVGRFADAASYYSHWIDTHPTDGDMAIALRNRCWVRAEMNRDLDQALADCEQSLKLRPHDPVVLSDRGLVHLRLGQLDQAIADYDAAIAADPKLSWTLYMRGLAKQKRGDQVGGDADIAAGLAANKNYTADAQRIGLLPRPAAAPAPAAKSAG